MTITRTEPSSYTTTTCPRRLHNRRAGVPTPSWGLWTVRPAERGVAVLAGWPRVAL